MTRTWNRRSPDLTVPVPELQGWEWKNEGKRGFKKVGWISTTPGSKLLLKVSVKTRPLAEPRILQWIVPEPDCSWMHDAASPSPSTTDGPLLNGSPCTPVMYSARHFCRTLCAAAV